MAEISKTKLEALKDRAKNALKRAAAVKETAESKVLQVIGVGEVAGGAFAGGYIQGRYNAPEWFGVPAEVAIGGGAVLAGLVEIAGEEGSRHVVELGKGFLAAYTSTNGRGRGKRAVLRSEYEAALALAAKTGKAAPAPPPEIAAEYQKAAAPSAGEAAVEKSTPTPP